MSKLKFKGYYKNIILPNKYRINYLHLSNLFTVEIVFQSADIISKYLQLETLFLGQLQFYIGQIVVILQPIILTCEICFIKIKL